MSYENLFKPIKIGSMLVSNRIVHSPTDTSTGDSDGAVNERIIAYHEEIAKGGTGLIIVGATTPDSVTGRPTVTCLSADADYMIPGLHRLSEAMQRHGAKCAIQLQHPGRQAAYPRTGQVSCSDIVSYQPGSAGHEVIYAGDQAHGKIAREMEVEEIYDLIEKFAEAAWRVQQAGFDSVELHAAHGYMIAQFMSPYTNKRNDRFGGPLIDRMRFPLEIISRIRQKCGVDFPILFRYSGEEFMPGSRELQESVEIAKILEQAGVAGLNISTGIFDAAETVMDPMYYNQGWNTYAAEAIKKEVKIPVITSHSLKDPSYCDRIIGEGKADLVGLSRQLIADPYWANKAKYGHEDDIRKCISCLVGCWKESLMIKQEMRCAINPAIGDTRFLDLKPARKAMKVAIVGGGVAGMEAARIAALRGISVTIFEKDNELGGILRACCVVPPKVKMRWYLDWIRGQLDKLGVEIKLNTAAGNEELSGYDVVLCGTGSKTVVPNIPGVGKAVKFDDVLICSNKNCKYWPEEGKKPAAEIGQKVIVWGDHYAACDTAEALALKGKEVIVITENSQFCANIDPVHREVMKARFNGGNGHGLKGSPISIPVDVRTNTTVVEIGDGEAILMNDKFEKETISVDNVILAKVESNTELFEQLLAAGLNVANIGDSKQIRNVRGAVTDGANAGLIIDDDVYVNANGALSNALPTDVKRQLGL
jgi:2,4-dienoyl-CoA reductase-like NADH-dependent reductase (Old Yellow Enzyme family)/thioredoxin reductase